MPPLALMFFTGFQLLLFNIFHLKGVKAPFRISSTLKGAPIKAPLFAIIEDAIAVDGHGGYPYREALTARYEASPMFRQMLVSLTFFWSISAITVAAASTAVIFTVPVTVAYGIGWTVPFIWAGIWTAITIKFVQSSLRKEKAAWRGEPKA
ncbi:MAG: hypothetical protein M1827_003027 [Pycnora praestabilis]|nr:MAG: hypothetical protein M1827_003027 [Pycnora praestabilis]